MEKLLFWFNICMIMIYMSAGAALYFTGAINIIPERSRKLAGIVIFCYGIYRLIASIIRKRKIKENEDEA